MRLSDSAVIEGVIKKLVALLVAGFAVFYLLTAPTAAADAVGGAVSAVIDGFGQVTVFFEGLVS